MSPFEIATAGRVVFGRGVLSRLGTLALGLGTKALVVTGAHPERAAPALAYLHEAGVAVEVVPATREPSVDDAREAVARARHAGCDLVVAIGGGSALDLGKAAAGLLTNGGDPLDYLEVVGKGRALSRRAAPMVAIPTTAGTGSEVTRNAVLESPADRVKVSLRSHLLLPEVALVDPELTVGVPPAVTAATGFDALAQLVEPFVSNRANPVTDALAREGMRRSAGALARAYENGADLEAREDLCLASLLGGICLANAGLGAVHGFAGPLGGRLGAPHGALCAALLPTVMGANVAALRAADPASPVLARYQEVARILTGRADAVAEDGAAWVRALAERLSIRPLSAFGARAEDAGAVAEAAARASSMKGNPVRFDPDALRALYLQAL